MSWAVMKGMMHSMTTSPTTSMGVHTEVDLNSLTLPPRVERIWP